MMEFQEEARRTSGGRDSVKFYDPDAALPTSPTRRKSGEINGSEPVSPKEEQPVSPKEGQPVQKKPSIKLKKQCSKIFRIRTKILQNLGKADKTTDDVFDEYEVNFNKQQINANRLQKEVTNYLRCARALHGASKALYTCLEEVYEGEWVGHDLIYAQAQNSDMIWTDFCHKIQDQTLSPLTSYVSEFPEIKKKIDKRGRKLVDYDSQRHQLEGLQRSARRDEYKIARGRDQLETARTTYQALNKELYEALPSIYDQRIPQVANSLQSLYAAEGTFMQESSKIARELEAIAEKLGKECIKGIYNAKRGVPPKNPMPMPLTNELNDDQGEDTKEESGEAWSTPKEELSMGKEGLFKLYPKIDNANVSQSNSVELHAVESNTLDESKVSNDDKVTSTSPLTNGDSNGKIEEGEDKNPFINETKSDSGSDNETPPKLPTHPPPYTESSPSDDVKAEEQPKSDDVETRPTISSPVTGKESGRPYEVIDFEDKVNGTRAEEEATTNAANGDISTKIPPGATTTNLPPGVLYKVKASYKYQAEDVDEISFDIEEIIQVVEYEDPEEQEEGWLCGVKESTNEKGLFPANFTRPM